MFYKKNRTLNFYLLGLLGSLAVTLNSYADNAAEGQVCAKPVVGIWYAFTLENLRTRKSERTSLAEGTKCIEAKVGDQVCYSVVLGGDIGCFTIGILKEQKHIPLGGGIQAWGNMWYPEWEIIPKI